jgi:tRNA nucleotidyltransferase (CCA-adding enzyme)
VLAHDFGKPATTVQAEQHGHLRWKSPGHEAAGGPLAETFLQRVGAPLELIKYVRPLVENHLFHHHGNAEFSDTSIRKLARRLAPADIYQLCLVMRADHDGRPPLPPSQKTLQLIDKLWGKAVSLEFENIAPRPILKGRHLLALGLKPGPEFKPVLDAAFEAQLEGAFVDEASGVSWLNGHLRNR